LYDEFEQITESNWKYKTFSPSTWRQKDADVNIKLIYSCPEKSVRGNSNVVKKIRLFWIKDESDDEL